MERETVRFSMNKTEYIINITKVRVYPQAYAAAITASDRLKESKIANIIDIGGYTVDCLQLNSFKPNMNLCTSLYTGVRTLFDDINDIIRSTGAKDLDDSIIEGVLTKDAYYLAEYSPKKIAIIEDAAQKHVDKMLSEISQKGFDLEEQKAVFMGGGSLLLKDYILKSKKAEKCIFIDDVYANAKGYKLLYEAESKVVKQPNIGETNG